MSRYTILYLLLPPDPLQHPLKIYINSSCWTLYLDNSPKNSEELYSKTFFSLHFSSYFCCTTLKCCIILYTKKDKNVYRYIQTVWHLLVIHIILKASCIVLYIKETCIRDIQKTPHGIWAIWHLKAVKWAEQKLFFFTVLVF